MLELKDNDFKVTTVNMMKNPQEKVRSSSFNWKETKLIETKADMSC